MSYDNFTTIDWLEDADKENRVRLYRIQRYSGSGWRLALTRAYSACQSWVVLASAGAIIGLIAVFINIAAALMADLRTGYCQGSWYLNRDFCCMGRSEKSCDLWVSWSSIGLFQYIAYIVTSVSMATLACLFVLEYAPYAAGSGISEIKCIVAGFVMNGFLGFRTLAIKSIALPFTVASGFSVGKEGPSVHYAACVGNVVGRMFSKYRKHNSKRRELLTACTAAGVAVAFGSPIGGVMFSLEEISSVWDLSTIWRSYFCCLIATGVLILFNPFRSGQMVLFSVRYDHPWHMIELPLYIIIGIFGGLMGHFIIKYNLRIQAWRKRYLKEYPMVEVFTLAVVTAAICYFNGFLDVDMTKSMQILFHECSNGWTHSSCDVSQAGSTILSLLCAILIRLSLVLVSYGAKVPAGIFVPAMAIGALFGRLIGTIAWAVQQNFRDSAFFSYCPPDGPCVEPGIFAFLGAGALLSGVMHMNVTVVIVMFELTGAVMYIIPTMIVVGVTTLIATWLDEGGIADMAIVANGFPFFTEEMEFHGKVADVMTKPRVVEEYGEIPSPLEHSAYPVVDHDGFLVGAIDREDLAQLDTSGRFDPDQHTVNRGAITVSPETRLGRAHELFMQLGPRSVYVVDKGILVGLVTRKDLLRAYNETVGHSSPLSPFADYLGERVVPLINNLTIKARKAVGRFIPGRSQSGS